MKNARHIRISCTLSPNDFCLVALLLRHTGNLILIQVIMNFENMRIVQRNPTIYDINLPNLDICIYVFNPVSEDLRQIWVDLFFCFIYNAYIFTINCQLN